MKRVDKIAVRTCLIFAIVLTAVMAVGLVVMALFNKPIADQYGFMAGVNKAGVMGYTASQYMNWSGRLIQPLGIGIMYKLFGYNGAQMAVPLIFLFLFSAAWSWLISQIMDFKKHGRTLSILIGSLIASSILCLTVCLFDIFLWLDSAFVHLLGMIMIVYDISVFIWMIKNKDKLKKKKWLMFGLLTVVFIGQTASEASMVLATGWSFIALMATCFVKKSCKEYRKVALTMFLVLLGGGLIMVLAPGLWTRAGQVSAETTIWQIVFNGPIRAYGRLFSSIELWEVAVTLVVAIVTGLLIKDKINKKNLKQAIIAGLLVFISLTYVPMVLYYYGSHAVGIEARVLGMPSMGVFIGTIIILTSIHAYILQNISKKLKNKYIAGVMITIGVLFVMGIFGVLKFEKGYLSALSVRAAALDVRERNIQLYKNGKNSKLEVADIPVMIEGSEATDFSGNGFSVVTWFYNSFLDYYDIPKEDIRVIGEKLVYGNSPEWYIEDGRQICTTNNEIVYEKYLCEKIEDK